MERVAGTAGLPRRDRRTGGAVLRAKLFLAASVIAAASLAAAGARGDDQPAPASPEAKLIAQQNEKQAALSKDIVATLEKSGFTDLKVMPASILVRGKDKSGNAVAMILNPGSMTEVVTLDPHSGSAAGGDGDPNGKAALTGSGTFATVLPSERLASTLIGLNVHGMADATIGTIKDLAIDHDGVQAYILGVGGVLGLGDRTVAVTPAALVITYDGAANSYHAAMNATAEQLKAAPDFKYEGSFKASRQ